VTVRLPGGVLTIDWAPGRPIVMSGGAASVFEGEVEL
jgi:diaminopimelate epimerase